MSALRPGPTQLAASMSLLRDARQGRRGGVLPWSLLIVGSAASLAANVAVADPPVWSRVIHAWPSFALMSAYELLMRHFRVTAHGERTAYPNDERSACDSRDESAGADVGTEAAMDSVGGRLHVVTPESDTTSAFGPVDPDGVAVPPIQTEA